MLIIRPTINEINNMGADTFTITHTVDRAMSTTLSIVMMTSYHNEVFRNEILRNEFVRTNIYVKYKMSLQLHL